MTTMTRQVSVTEFKAKCLSLLDEVGRQGGSLTITKRGRPLAAVVPVPKSSRKSPEGAWSGKLSFSDADLMADSSGLWDVLRKG